MIDYELLLLFPGSLSDEETASHEQTILQMLEAQGAAVRSHGLFERRKLAYPIDRARQGTYLSAVFDLEPERVAALERALRLEKSILRHLLVRAYRKTAKEIEQEAKFRAEESGRARGAAPARPRPDAAPAISPEQLEEKLEQILSDDMTKT